MVDCLINHAWSAQLASSYGFTLYKACLALFDRPAYWFEIHSATSVNIFCQI
jgi:hypothetical protein